MSMLFDISRLRGAERVTRQFEPAAFPASDDFRVVQSVDLDVEVRKDTKKVRIVGRVTTTLECACSRCLEPFTLPVDAKFDLLFVPPAEAAADDEREVGEGDLGVSVYKDEIIDLGEMMNEQFLLTLPMKPLCRPDCLGLCPVCGGNLNVNPCGHETEWVDPRMEALKRFAK